MFSMKLCLVYLGVFLSYCEAYKILVVYPVPARSHANLGDGVVRHLLKDGHEVTYISPYPHKSASPNLRVIEVSENIKAMPEMLINIESIMKNHVSFNDHGMVIHMLTGMVQQTIENKEVQKLFNDPKEQFDAVIAEWMFSELPAGIAAVFNCPLIWTSSVDVHWGILRLIDQPTNPAYTGDPMSAALPPFTFWQRLTELYTQLRVQFMKYMYFDGIEQQAYEKLLAPIVAKRGRQPPSYYDLQYNASLVLANAHVSLGQATAIPQNFIPVGGYHIEDEVKSLPEDLKKIMDNAKNGVVYFSMGSNLKSKDIPSQIKEGLLKTFGQLKQTVVWKFEEDLPNKPNNVHILKWAPQQSILAHPNTVLFITHGGLLSTTETIHFGVPIIGIPVFADQFINVARAVQRGFALKVDLSYTMADELKLAIEEVTSNPRYAEKAKQLSFVYHDRPVSPGEELVHWVKHVIATRGAAHLRSPASRVPFYQKFYLDLLAVILVILFVGVRIVKTVLCAVCSKKNVQGKKKKTN